MGERTGTVIAENRILYVPFKVPEGIFKWHFEFLKK